jgi:hypothetical protein
MGSKLLAKVSLQEKHLTYDIDRIITNITKMFIALNSKLKKRHVFAFVHDIFHEPQFDRRNSIENQYHNIYHTYEVVEMVACIVSNTKLKNLLTPFERTILLVAATCHDFGHNGISNTEWDDVSIKKQKARISSTSSLECLTRGYSDSWISDDTNYSPGNSMRSTDECLLDGLNESKSYNEVMHFDLSMCTVLKHKKTILDNKSNTEISQLLSIMILETDLRRHEAYMKKYENENTSPLDMMILVLKLSDISHSMRPFRVHLQWVYSLVRETRTRHIHRIKEVPTVEYMAFDTIRFGKKFVGDMLGIIVPLFPDFPPELLANYDTNLKIWESYLLN